MQNYHFESPDAARIELEENNIALYLAHTSEHKTENIEESDIIEEFSVSFKPEEFLSTIAMMLSALYDYQKKYNVDLGVTFDVKQEKSEDECSQ